MTEANVTIKGQFTIPLNIRRALQIDAGDRVMFVEVEPGQCLSVLLALARWRGLPRC